MEPGDQELVDLVREVPAGELARVQVELLWDRFVDSAELRDALLDESPGADYLREAFGRFDLPADQYLPHASTAPATSDDQESARAANAQAKLRDPPILVHISWLPIAMFALAIAIAVGIFALSPFWRRQLPREDAPPIVQPATAQTPKKDASEGLPPSETEPAESPSVNDHADTLAAPAEPEGDHTTESPFTPRKDDLSPSERGPTPELIPGSSLSRKPVEVPGHPPGVAHSVTGAASHPALIEMTKEGYNVWAELKAALDDRAYSDALRIMRLTPPGTQFGLLPDLADGDLFVPFDNLISRATRDHPELLSEMRVQYGPVAEVRLAAAIAECDVGGVEAVTVQFFGTEAAARARLWLGDRALSGGSFAEAVEHYRHVLAHGSPPDEQIANARLRLAGAMSGLDLGRPVTRPVPLGDTTMPAAEFEAMVARQRDRHAGANGPSQNPSPPSPDVPPAPSPAEYRLERWSAMPCGPRGWTQFDGDLGRTSADRDWAAWCLSAGSAGQLAILSNRQQVAAFDLPTGRRKWSQQFNDPRGFPATWNWAPMPPLVVEQRIYVRRIPRLTGPELVCLDRETGRVLWSSRPGDHVACGPFWLRGSLVAVTADSTEPSFPANPRRRKANAKQRVFHLHLTTFAPDEGHVLAKIPLVRLRDHWYGVLPCRATPVRNDLLITAGGVTLLVRLDGEIRWLRRQSFAWKQGESPRHDLYHGPPLVADDRVFTFQPGVEQIACLDLETGRRVWHSEIPKTTRVVGLAKDRLIVEADSKLLALHTDGGKIAWQNEPEGLTQAYLCGGLGGLAFVDRAALPLGGWRFELVWLDLSDGDVLQRHPLTEFPRSGRQPYIPQCGPFLQVAERLFVAVAEQHPRPTDRELFELLPAGGRQALSR